MAGCEVSHWSLARPLLGYCNAADQRVADDKALGRRPTRHRTPTRAASAEQLIRITTTLAVITVASVAAIISRQHANELVSSTASSV